MTLNFNHSYSAATLTENNCYPKIQPAPQGPNITDQGSKQRALG